MKRCLILSLEDTSRDVVHNDTDIEIIDNV